MRLLELFDIPADTKDKRLDQDIDYAGDLKFFIDNDNDLLSKHFFPAIKKHKEDLHSEDPAEKYYMEPVKHCLALYIKKFNLDDIKDKIFTDDLLKSVAQRFADEQREHIDSGAYDR